MKLTPRLAALLVVGAAAPSALAAPVLGTDFEGKPIVFGPDTEARTGKYQTRYEEVDLATVPLIPTKVIFLNDCHTGCTVRPGNTDSRQDTSSIVSRTGTLTAYNRGAASWNKVVACMKDVFSQFNVTVTTTDPGTADHFEIMIAGTGSQLGLQGVLGVAPFNCSTYIPYSLSFAFANDPNAGAGNPNTEEEICATAAQEIAHTWALDHTIVASDPLTYYSYTAGRRRFNNGVETCGSDCGPMSGLPIGQSPSGLQCTGPNVSNVGPQQHQCSCGGNGQNPVAVITNLFGVGNPTPPTVAITSPKNGDTVNAGFAIQTNITDDSGVISKVELRVDNMLTQTLTSAPYAFNAPTTLGNGTHRVEVTGYDGAGTPGKAFIDVIIGKPCGGPSDCPNSTDTCVAGRCVPGSDAPGGLGTVCTDSAMCASGQCGSSGSGEKYCVEACDPTKGGCPSGFGCLASGGGGGVCWPGVDDGFGDSGGCGCASSGEPSGPIVLGLAFGLAFVVRRRRA